MGFLIRALDSTDSTEGPKQFTQVAAQRALGTFTYGATRGNNSNSGLLSNKPRFVMIVSVHMNRNTS